MKKLILHAIFISLFCFHDVKIFSQAQMFGVHATDLMSVSIPTLDRIAKMLDSADIRWVRINLAWKDIEPTEGSWNWHDYKERIEILKAHNINILALMYKVPNWASSAPLGTNPQYTQYYVPKDTLKWMIYIDSTLMRFKNYISYWEIWNEPDGGFLYVPVKGTKHLRYLEVLRTAYNTIKKADASAKVVFAGLTSQINSYPKSLFIDTLMALGAANYFDVMNVHFYRYEDKPVEKVKEILAKFNKNVPVWVTETNNWRSLLPNNTEQRSADSLKSWLDYVKALGPEKIFWFELTNFNESPTNDSTAWGLFSNNTFAPTAVYSAYKDYISNNSLEINKQTENNLELYQNYPNPFSGITNIRFILPVSQQVKLEIFDIFGRRIKVLINKELMQGEHQVSFDAVNITGGVYFCRLQTGNNNSKIISMLKY